jgi:heme/copper-type cytochrome/quinol oxidase subunit 2
MSMKLPHRADTLSTPDFSAVAAQHDDLTLWIGLIVLAAIVGAVVCLLVVKVRRSRGRRGPADLPASAQPPIEQSEGS